MGGYLYNYFTLNVRIEFFVFKKIIWEPVLKIQNCSWKILKQAVLFFKEHKRQ